MKLNFPPKIFVGFMVLMLADYSFGVGKEYNQNKTITKNNYLSKLNLRLDDLDSDEWLNSADADNTEQFIAKKKKRRRKKKKRRRRPSSSSSGSSGSSGSSEVSPILYLLPLGIGQFANGSAILGSLFGVAQVGGLGFMFVNWTGANTKIEETNAYIDERNAEFDAIPAANTDEKIAHQTITDENVQAFDAEAEAMINSANIGLIVFFVAYAGSIVEAFVSGPSDDAGGAGGKKKRRKRRRRSSIEGLDQDIFVEEQVSEPFRPISPSWNVKLAPSLTHRNRRVISPDLTLKWQLKF